MIDLDLAACTIRYIKVDGETYLCQDDLSLYLTWLADRAQRRGHPEACEVLDFAAQQIGVHGRATP